jgi:hypothetical protein
MTLKSRNQIVPQMSDYDKIGEQWVPYLMRADNPSVLFESVTTDRWGLRNTIRKDGSVLSVDALEINKINEPIGAILGSSAVFGVGCTHDRFTIPSFLCEKTNINWLNLGGRAYNSTQELIKLNLHFPKKLDHLIIYSGVNNLTLAFLSSTTSPVYNTFFSQSTFDAKMTLESEYIGVRRAWSRLLLELRHRFRWRALPIGKKCIENSYKDILICFERDLRVAKAMAIGIGANIGFVMQPLATWLDKKLTKEEQEIFNILDAMSGDWKVLSDYIGDIRERYFDDVAFICKKNDVKYFNLNLMSEFESNEWLFVDRVHLTDRGCEIAAKLIKEEFLL